MVEPVTPVATPDVLFKDPVKFFNEVGGTRRTWAELEQHARESPFQHRPLHLPSVVRHSLAADILQPRLVANTVLFAPIAGR